ncbi:dermonecrotic toxin domain-containing protein [Pseudomonas sp. H1h]|uniref:dermonecrotic toxin domain-containing protein n=1 Tax=Pseudomonas sp. H1h TaxID=1397280 RepID=UPI000469BC20|nr:DUF6543 domain-containing protein [Pseudomonas sp. H1h]
MHDANPKQIPPASDSSNNSVHFEHVSQALPSWLTDALPSRINRLKPERIDVSDPQWDALRAIRQRTKETVAGPAIPETTDDESSTPAPQAEAVKTLEQRLKKAIGLNWTAQNDIDRALEQLQDVYSFARPLLQQALKSRFGVEDDVEQTCLRLYAPVKTAWWVHDFSGGTNSRTVSLLDAALHNFSRDEQFSPDSEFITRPDAREHFQVKRIKHKMSIEQFKSLCRELDIGAQYLAHLNTYLRSSNPVAANILRHKATHSDKAALNVAAHIARLHNDIDQSAYDVVLGMLNKREPLKWNGQSVGYYNLSIMDTQLSGIVLIAPEAATASSTVPVLAYVPHDPQHPLKQYPSSLQFMEELTRQLTEKTSPENYQRFFSQFVPHQQRGMFFSRLNERLSQVKWQPAPPGSNMPSWRETPVDRPYLQFRASNIKNDRSTVYRNDLWAYLHEQKLNQILNDAQQIAISTAYVDRMARWAWWDNLQKMLADIFNVALLVAIPLVPGLGPLMMAYTAYQLTDEVVEGIVDLAEGNFAEAMEQTLNVLQSVVQLGAFAAAGAIGSIARAKLSSFYEGLKPVQLANGQSRLWHPDLTPYHQPDLALPTEAKPDAQGIHLLEGKQVLRLQGQQFAVKQDSATGQYRIRHPRRSEAYTPTLRHNNHGAWVIETENPREWAGSILMRRLGPVADAYSDEQLELLRRVCGTDEGALRRMHVDNTAPPPLLIDTLQRLGNAPDETRSTSSSPATGEVLQVCPQLTSVLADRVVAHATPLELQQLTLHRRVPLRLKTTARELQFELQSVRAAQGLQQTRLSNIDSERLILGALRQNTDAFGELRIEIREAAFDGELRSSAGSDTATRVRVLVHESQDHYRVRDGADQPIHEACGLYEAILHATDHQGRSVLGYRPSDADQFQQWVIAKTTTPSERRAVLRQPPVRPVASFETQQILNGPRLSRYAVTLHERIEDVYPHFSRLEIDTFANALTEQGEPIRAIETFANELDEYRQIMHRWRYQQPDSWGPDSQNFRDGGGLHIFERLLDCIERKNAELGQRTDPSTYALDLSRELLPLDLQTWWSRRPAMKKLFDKVTVLKLDNTRFSADLNGLLRDFPNVLELSAKNCELTQLPRHIATTMHRLERLRLSDNHVVLDSAAVKQLRDLTYLEVLRLENNPLTLPPDISRMPRLKVLILKNTGLQTWPDGTLDKTRPRGFLLDLRDNPINRIPEVSEGSPAQWLVARTRLDVGTLSETEQLQYQAYRHSVGLPAEPVFAPEEENRAIVSNYGVDFWGDVPGWGVYRETPWSELVEEPAAQPFMQVLLGVREYSDYRAGGAIKDQLMQRVWRMLDAVHADTRLREKLFTMASAPVDCADAGAQMFNSMGINVLASEVYLYNTDAAQIQKQLVTLAKGAARLDLVNEVARADVQSRGGNPDEVEVYLAYQTGLAQRLSLPWQSQTMLYRRVAGVSDAMIDQAYTTVQALSEGDGLVNRMLDQDFWKQFMEQTWPVRLQSNKRLYLDKYERLETLREVQREWATRSLDDVQRAQLRSRLRELMNELPVPATVVFADEAISDSTFDRLLTDLWDEEKELARRLTRAALSKAGQ